MVGRLFTRYIILQFIRSVQNENYLRTNDFNYNENLTDFCCIIHNTFSSLILFQHAEIFSVLYNKQRSTIIITVLGIFPLIVVCHLRLSVFQNSFNVFQFVIDTLFSRSINKYTITIFFSSNIHKILITFSRSQKSTMIFVFYFFD